METLVKTQVADDICEDLNDMYARILGGVNTDGFEDHGIDVTLEDRFGFQVKSSLYWAERFFAKALLHGLRYIPMALGQPGDPGETEFALRQAGIWVGYDVPHREKALQHLTKLRDLLEGKEPLPEAALVVIAYA